MTQSQAGIGGITPEPKKTLRTIAQEAFEKGDRDLLTRGKQRVYDKLGHRGLLTATFQLTSDRKWVDVQVDGLKLKQALDEHHDILFLVRPEDNYVVNDLADLGRHLAEGEPTAREAYANSDGDALSESGV